MEPSTTRAGVILAVADIERSMGFYKEQLGFDVEAVHDDPPYATLAGGGMRLSLAEQGHPADDRPGVMMVAPADPATVNAAIVIEVPDALSEHARRASAGVASLAPVFAPPWGGHRFFVNDPDGNLVEIEQPA